MRIVAKLIDVESDRHFWAETYDRQLTDNFAYIHAGLGDAEQAIDWLERAVTEGTGPAYGMKGSFLFSTLQNHPRFRALLQRMHLA